MNSEHPRVLVEGTCVGEVLRLDEPLSFWGGIDPSNGRVMDLRHPQAGQSVTDRVLVLPFGRGSSSGSSTLAECIRAKTAPSAILLLESDEIIALGAIIADELYKRTIPVVVLDRERHSSLHTGDLVAVGSNGSVIDT